ncbi:hypothetical protein H7Y63_01995 [Polaromonas sp.]|nr:hypothetical protein [Candidatus Saccharibacteria bacterium]
MKHSSPNQSKLVRTGAFLALGTVALIGLNQYSNDGTRKHYDVVEKAAIAETETVPNLVLAVRAGATYHTAPIMQSNREEGPTTTAGTVPKGMVLRVDRPLKHVDDIGDTWYGFSIVNDKAAPNTAKTDDINWINATQLDANVTGGEPFVTGFSYPGIGPIANPTDISVNVSANQKLESSGKEQIPLASGQIIADAVFEQQINREHLGLVG